MRGGMGYGFGGTIGTAGPVWNSSWGGEITKAGVPVYDTADPQRGSSRRRKSRRGGDEPAAYTDDQKELTMGPPPTPSLVAPPTAETAPRTGLLARAPARADSEGGRRRRKTRKGGNAKRPGFMEPRPTKPRPAQPPAKGGRKTRKARKMRGGMSVAHASAGFAGTGSRGLADYKDVGSSQPFSNDVVPLK